ncbi:MAG: SBBP repeat-containing protein [Flavobacteriales bacterium]
MLRRVLPALAFLPTVLLAQPFQWAAPLNGASARGMAMVTDALGNVYVCGNVNGVADFDPGPDTVLNASAGINGDNYLVKYGPSGNYLWHLAVGGSGTEIPKGLALDHSGNLLMVGRFDSYFDWDPGIGEAFFGSAGSTDGFVAKYDTSGNYLWAQRIGGSSHDEAYGVTVDANDNVYVTGWMNGTIDFDNGPEVLALTNPGGPWDAYCVRYDPSGQVQWVRGIQGAGAQRGMSLVYLGGHVYFYGVFSGVTVVHGTHTLTSSGQGDDYLCKLDTSGAVVWARNLGGPENEQAEAIRSDGTHLYITGTFAGTIDADPGPGVLPLASIGGRSQHYTKLDTAGNALWSHQVRGNNHFDGVCDLAVDGAGNVFVTGAYYEEQDFDDGPGEFILAPVIANDLFLLKVDAAGNFLWARSIATGGVFDTANGLATDANGNVFVTGGYGETAVFDPEASNGSYSGGTGMTGFTAKYGVDFTALPPTASTALQLQLYPNPSRELVTLVLPTAFVPERMTVTDAQGRVAMHWQGRIPTHFSVAHLAPGTYHATLHGAGQVATGAFVVGR